VHHTWGVPVIPGSALKGLVAHYVDATYGPTDPGKAPWEQLGDERVRADYQGVTWNRRRIERGPGAIYRAVFGAPDARKDDQMREHGLDAGAATGLVTFHDALYVPESIADDKPFTSDVLTVHQKDYYNSSGGSWPNDYDSPNPVAFLTVRPECRLLLALSGPSEWTELAAQLLADALKNWGVGGKTAAGYGMGMVDEWKAPEPRRSKTEQAVIDLEKHSKDALSGDIERWLRGEAVTGPMRAQLSAAPDATSTEHLDVVRAIGVRFDLRTAWASRLTNKKADEQKKARARALIEAWDKLFPAGDRT
jgi:CRISPR type III-B/RAMP module RAMP protein Cmr6